MLKIMRIGCSWHSETTQTGISSVLNPPQCSSEPNPKPKPWPKHETKPSLSLNLS